MRIPWAADAGSSECHFHIFSERPRCLVTRLLLQSPSPDLSEDEFTELVSGDCGGRWGLCPYAVILSQIPRDAPGAAGGSPAAPEVVEDAIEEIAEAVETEAWGIPGRPEDTSHRAEVEFSDRRPDLDGILCDAAIVATDEFLTRRSVDFSQPIEDRIRDEVMTLARPISIGGVVSTSGCGSGHPMIVHCVTHGLGSRPESMDEAYAVVSIGLKTADNRGCRSASILDVFAGFEPKEREFLLQEFAKRCAVESWKNLELIIIYPGEAV